MPEPYIFGDDDPLDQYADEGEPDPQAVTMRIYEVAAFLDAAAEREIPGWDTLEGDEQAFLIALGEEFLITFMQGDDQSPQSAAIALHEVQQMFTDSPGWNELDAEEQTVAMVFADHLVEWLVKEGSLKV
jgi:hypothetical protein